MVAIHIKALKSVFINKTQDGMLKNTEKRGLILLWNGSGFLLTKLWTRQYSNNGYSDKEARQYKIF